MAGHISIVLAILGLLCAAGAVYALLMPGPQAKGNGVAENVFWGKLFVAATYASIAIFAFLAIGKLR